MALKRRCPEIGLLHHSDQGSTYASEDYQRLLASRDITCSMSRRGNCYDNAVMESFFSTVKSEIGERFPSNGDAKMQLFDYIEVFYNQRRRHSSVGRMSPAAFEQKMTQAAQLNRPRDRMNAGRPRTLCNEKYGRTIDLEMARSDPSHVSSRCSVSKAGVAISETTPSNTRHQQQESRVQVLQAHGAIQGLAPRCDRTSTKSRKPVTAIPDGEHDCFPGDGASSHDPASGVFCSRAEFKSPGSSE